MNLKDNEWNTDNSHTVRRFFPLLFHWRFKPYWVITAKHIPPAVHLWDRYRCSNSSSPVSSNGLFLFVSFLSLSFALSVSSGNIPGCSAPAPSPLHLLLPSPAPFPLWEREATVPSLTTWWLPAQRGPWWPRLQPLNAQRHRGERAEESPPTSTNSLQSSVVPTSSDDENSVSVD